MRSIADARIYICQGDLTRLSAHAIVLSTSTSAHGTGMLQGAFEARFPAFAAQFAALQSEWSRHRVPIGTARWLPQNSQSAIKPGGVVAVAAAGGPWQVVIDNDWKSAESVKGALRCAIEHARKQFPGERLLIALPTLRIGSGGSANIRLIAARSQIRAAREVLQHEHDVDAVFVPYTPEDYQVFLEARRREKCAPRPHTPPSPELSEAIASGRCVPFVGAGLSSSSGLPDWNTLIAAMAGELGVEVPSRSDDPDYFLDLAQFYRDTRPEGHLEQLIRRTFFCGDCGACPTPAHYWLMSMPLRYIVTTNYDDLLEIAAEGLRRFTVTVRSESDVALAAGPLEHILKIHGDARDSCPEVTLSRDDYDEFFHRHPAMASLLEGLLLNQTFLFLGYGLRDANFRQIYNRIALMLRETKRPAYVTVFGNTSSLTAASWGRKKLQPLAMRDERDLWDFLDNLAETAQGRDRLFLSPDARDDSHAPSAPFTALRLALDDVAQATMSASHAHLSPDEAAQTARVLDFLIECGWRPASMNANSQDARIAAREALAQRSEPATARRILLTALSHVRNDHDAARIRRQIEELERSIRPS